ncbi:MAG TPA: ABC transporter permease [Candidatus Solibacter sp.]|nr:ABC transporter permease [Candidatus Solibacter sp.]
MSAFPNDLRQAMRALLKDRGYTAVALLTLAFGVAANTIIFSVVDAVLLRPLTYRDPGRLMVINEVVPEVAQIYPRLPANARHFFEWRDRCRSFSQFSLLETADFVLTRAGEPEQLHGARVSANLFTMLGVRPQIGRSFLPEEEEPGRDREVMISDAVWTRRFHRDPSLIGRAITLDGAPWTVVGVLPADFHFPKSEVGLVSFPRSADVFRPLAFKRDEIDWFGQFNYVVLGRLQPGAPVQRALAEMNVVQSDIATHFPEKMHLTATLTPLQEEVTGSARKGLVILFAAVGAVLLIVCVNLANLSLARAAGRWRELAIRMALGAGRAQLVRYILGESLVVGLAGGLAGVALAWAGLRAVLLYAPLDLPRLDEIALDGRAVAFAFGISILTGLLFGLLPAWRASSADPQFALRGSSRSATEGRQGLITRDLLVGAESCLSAVLLIVAGLLIGSFIRLLNVDKGFNIDKLIAVEVSIPQSSYHDNGPRTQYFRQLVAKMQALPGVTSAAIVTRLPLQGEDWVDGMQREGEHLPLAKLPLTNMRFCSSDYFRTMGIPFVAGHSFDDAETKHLQAVISEQAAKRLWGNENPIGRRFRRGDPDEPPIEVAGVVRDVRPGLAKEPVLTAYFPYWYRNGRLSMTAVLRTSNDPRGIAPAMRSTVWSIDPDTVVGEIRTMQNVVSNSVGQRRFQVMLIAGFAVSALLLSCLGIYGVVSWSVARRRNEIGVRMALGATSGNVRRMVVAQGLRPVLAGLAAGILASLASARVLSSMLFGVSPRDPWTIGAVVLALAAVAALACYIPARRTTLSDPLEALRYE